MDSVLYAHEICTVISSSFITSNVQYCKKLVGGGGSVWLCGIAAATDSGLSLAHGSSQTAD